MVSLGLLLETGDHAPKDLKAAYALYEKAAERGSADGALDLAVALVKGKGIDEDVPRALALLRRPPTTARPARPTTSPRSSRAASAASRRARRSPSSGAPRREGYPEGYRAAAVLLDEGRGVAEEPGRRRG